LGSREAQFAKMAGGEKEQQDGGRRAIGDMDETREGDTHILIPDKDNKETTTKTGNTGKLLITLGTVTFLVSVSIDTSDQVIHPFT
jgi:hypothetical protein